jgi:hypothetical protein
VITVGTDPIATPVYVVGTWRDINLPQRPADILSTGGVFDLGTWDYDSGFVGKPPPTYDLDDHPAIMVNPTDGQLDAAATAVTPSIHVAKAGGQLYVATDPPSGGRDRFLFVSPTAPGAAVPAMWGKAGRVPFSSSAVFLAGEADNNFAGWFHFGAGTPDTQFTAATGRGAVLEGAIDLAVLGSPMHVWVCALSYGTADNGALDPATQSPTGNGDGDVSAMEVVDVDLGTL